MDTGWFGGAATAAMPHLTQNLSAVQRLLTTTSLPRMTTSRTGTGSGSVHLRPLNVKASSTTCAKLLRSVPPTISKRMIIHDRRNDPTHSNICQPADKSHRNVLAARSTKRASARSTIIAGTVQSPVLSEKQTWLLEHTTRKTTQATDSMPWVPTSSCGISCK